MKESKKVSKSKRNKSPSSSSLGRKKPTKSKSQSKQSSNAESKKKLPRKSRWEILQTGVAQTSKVENTESQPLIKKEKEEDTSSILEMLDQKEKIIDCLFLSVTGNALQELIPDYLKKFSIDELKKLCLEELNNMSNDSIKSLISGKESSSVLKDQETQTEIDSVIKIADVGDESKNMQVEKTQTPAKVEGDNVKRTEDSAVEGYILRAEEVLEEVAKDLGISNTDAELLELEMRARAIRSLLKLKPSEDLDSEMI